MKNDIENLRVVIVDDERHSREIIRSLISSKFPEIEICGEADSVDAAVKILEKCHPDLLFLDIELPDGTGFDVLEAIGEDIQFEIIFATAYNYYAIRAIKFSALDYLLKPVDKTELVAAIEKAKTRIVDNNHKTSNINLLKKQIVKPAPDKIALPAESGFIFVPIDDIIRCQADSNYTRFVLSKGSPVLVSRTLKEYDELLDENNFFRVHNSHLINMAHVKKYLKGKTPRVVMSDGTEVEVSIRKKDAFLRHFAKL